MGKVVTIYFSDEEAQDLKDFCDENRCTQYSALKTAVKQLLHKPLISFENVSEDIIENHQVDIDDPIDEIEDSKYDETLEEELSLVDKIRGYRSVKERENSESLSALARLLKKKNPRVHNFTQFLFPEKGNDSEINALYNSS
jgi:hypothetical protein